MAMQEKAGMQQSIPIACAFSGQKAAARKEQLIAAIATHVIGRSELMDGYEYRFSAEIPLTLLADFIQSERQCCSFFTFELIVSPELVALRLRGSAEIKQFIEHNGFGLG